MPRGRRPKPPAVRLLEGNAGHREIPAAPEVHPLTEVPPPAKWLDKGGKDHWAKVAPWFVDNGLVSEKDLGALEVLCDTYSQAVRLRRKARRDPSVLPAADRAAESYRKYCAEFGLTPSSQTRVKQPKTGGQKNPWTKKFVG